MNPLSYFYTIRSYVDAYSGFIGRRFLSVIWVVAIGFVIWFYGYLLKFGDFQPLASAGNRLIAIGVVLAAWLLYLGISFLRSRRRDNELVEGIEQDAEALAEGERTAEVDEIRNQLRQALALLRRVSRKRFGYIYELPWYVLFGAPGSGKTTAITHSGLTFPVGMAEGEGTRGIAGTRSCNWWFCEEAILVDTAGRYTTQDDLSGAAKAGWDGFLNLIRKYRRSQPVNGVLITLSIADLVDRPPDARLEEVRAIRKRLNEMDEVLKARIPAYLVLTKADLLTGFIEFFDGFNRSDREQVWGMTFDLADSDKAKDLPERFLEEFSLLQERVGSMLIERLQQEPDVAVRGRIFRFPAELSALKDTVHEILVELCSGSKLVEAPLVRGVYLASGTQMTEGERGLSAQPIPRMRRSYFLTRLFKDVIFGEASLVNRDRRLSSRQRMVRRIAYGAAALVLAFVMTSWTLTYFRNTAALAQAEERIDAYQDAVKGIPVRDVDDADFLRILPALNNLSAIADSFERPGVWPASFGLDQRPKIESRRRAAYQRALNALLLPRLLVQLQTTMRESDDPAALFEALKLYGMLGGLGDLDPDYVVSQSKQLFSELYPEEGRAGVREALVAHTGAMATGTLPPLTLDNRLIAETRDKISDRSYAQRAFDILASKSTASALPSFVPADALGPIGERAFERASGDSLRAGIDGLYTGNGYRMAVLPLLGDAASEALSETWVRGSSSTVQPTTIDAVSNAALDIYFDTFQRRWSELLGDIRVRPSQTLAEETETARLLATDPSPIESLAQAVAEATDLRPVMTEGKATEIAESAGAAAASSSASPLALANAPDPYGPLRAALEVPEQAEGRNSDATSADGSEKPSQIAALQPLIDTIYQQLSRASTSTAAVAEVFNAEGELTKANQDLLQTARRLPEPVATWMAGLSADISALAVKTARTSAREAWASSGANLCAAAVTNRYPFTRDSPDDVSLADFTRLFGPQGLFATFFEERLAPFVDTTASPWTWRGTFGADGLEAQAIAQFERAHEIRRAFFPPNSEEPSVAINVEPVSLSQNANAVLLEIENERVVYYHGPKIGKTIRWPSSETDNQSRIAFQPGDISQAMTRSGDWSPFRIFDEATIVSHRNDLMRVRFDDGPRQAVFDVQFGSVLNPFQLPALSEFQCPSQF
ncbi:type VI secretion system membrane subunit TssM [Afifella aestuarii]|uniref:type VI secretion system membrane subunit TssM n=1 Tax=Afifella aestuarii TaxID=1909496 RepID=UPI000FE40C93|nr:type VI secretion system membrane subunit TssM [Afifella aestuarii]